MEPIIVVLAALTAGAGASSAAGKDAYTHLKGLIKDRVTDKAEATLVLERFEENPDGQQDAVKNLLATAQLQDDPGALRQAQRVLELVETGSDGEDTASSEDVDPQGVVDGDYE